MIPATLLKVLSVGIFASSAAAEQFINAVWSTTAFETFGGNNDHGIGFSLIDANGEEIFHTSYPNGYSPCQGNGYTFTISGGCFAPGQQYEFECHSEFDGSPKDCTVYDSSMNELAHSDGSEDTKFIGIAIGQDGKCGAAFPLGKNTHCAPHSENFNVT